jgi:hypothetical protein
VFSLIYPTYNAHAPYSRLWPAPLHIIFPHYLINVTIFVKTLLNTKCLFWFSLQLLSETFLIQTRIERDVVKNVCWYAWKIPVIPARLKNNLRNLDRVSKNIQISIFIKIRPVVAQLFRVHRRTDMTQLTILYRNFANPPKSAVECNRQNKLLNTVKI